MNTLLSIYTQFMEFSKSNQMVAGAVSLWGLGLLTYLARNVPTNIFKFLKYQLTTSLSFNNGGDDINLTTFNNFISWTLTTKGAVFSRQLSLSTGLNNYGKIDKPTISAGYGGHFFIFNNRIFYFHKEKLPSSGTYKEKEEIVITTYGRNQIVFNDLVAAFLPKEDDTKLPIYGFDNEWACVATSRKRDISTVITPGNLKQNIISHINEFSDSKIWYTDRGINYKQIYVLHGPPGTGKTSLVKAIATHLNKSIFILNISDMSNHRFSRAINTLPSGSICLIEDFDDNSAVKSRASIEKNNTKVNKDNATPTTNTEHTLLEMYNTLSLSNILNTLDGIGDLDGIVIFMTTNCIDSIDPALLRKGRADYTYFIGYLTDMEIKEYIEVMFPDKPRVEDRVFDIIPGCDLAALFIENKYNYDAFIASIP